MAPYLVEGNRRGAQVKRHLGLHLLWSTKPVALAQQVWATLTIAQVLLALWMEIAGRAKVEVFDVSLALLVTEAPLLAAAGRDPLEVFVTEGRHAGYIRPSRRLRRTAPEIGLEEYRPLPPELVLTRTPRYDTGQGSIPFTPAAEVSHAPPPWTPAAPERRHRGGGSSRKKCRDT